MPNKPGTPKRKRIVISDDEDDQPPLQQPHGVPRIDSSSSEDEEEVNKMRNCHIHKKRTPELPLEDDEEEAGPSTRRRGRKRRSSSLTRSRSPPIIIRPKLTSAAQRMVRFQNTYYQDEYRGDPDDAEDDEDASDIDDFVVPDDQVQAEEEDDSSADDEQEDSEHEDEIVSIHEEEQDEDDEDEVIGPSSSRYRQNRAASNEVRRSSRIQRLQAEKAEEEAQLHRRVRNRRLYGDVFDDEGNIVEEVEHEEAQNQDEGNANEEDNASSSSGDDSMADFIVSDEDEENSGAHKQLPVRQVLTSTPVIKGLTQEERLWNFPEELVLRVIAVKPKCEAKENGYPMMGKGRFYKALLTNMDGVLIELQAWGEQRKRLRRARLDITKAYIFSNCQVQAVAPVRQVPDINEGTLPTIMLSFGPRSNVQECLIVKSE